MDANACIKHALYFVVVKRSVRDFFCIPIRGFVNGCLVESIPIGHFTTEKSHSYQNITKAVNNLCKERNIPYYEGLKLLQKGKINLDHLFSKLVEFPEKYTDPELIAALLYFQAHQKDLSPYLEPGRVKDPIPEDHDLRLLVCSHNLGYSPVSLVSDDMHFVAYSNEISNNYNVQVLPVKDLLKLVTSWSWVVPT